MSEHRYFGSKCIVLKITLGKCWAFLVPSVLHRPCTCYYAPGLTMYVLYNSIY